MRAAAGSEGARSGYNACDMKAIPVGTLALTLYLLASSLVALAQPTGKVHRIGFLRHFACSDEFGVKDLRQKRGELGHIEGPNIVIECRAAPGKWEELPKLADELVRLGIDLLVTEGTPASLAPQPVSFYAAVFFLVNVTYIFLIWELIDRRPIHDVPPKVRRMMRVRSVATLCLFGAAAIVALKYPLVGLGICVACLVVYLKPEAPGA